MSADLFRTSRRMFLGQSAIGAASLLTFATGGLRASAASSSAVNQQSQQKVRFSVGDSFIVGNLYLPTDYRPEERYPAIVVGGSLTAVKEQMGGIYAAEMARRGFLALAIDYRHYGESGGEPRQYEDPETKAEDLVASVAYLASRGDVRPSGIGLVGVCTSGGTVLYAAARDSNVGAVATVAGHFSEPSLAAQFYAGMFGTGPDVVERFLAEGRAARERYQRSGENTLITAYGVGGSGASHVGPMEYYMDLTRGGGVAEWKNAFSVMSWEPWLDFDPVSAAASVTAPTLIVHSDGSVLPEQARKIYGLLRGAKTLHWTDGNHFDFYDGPAKVREATDAIAAHFHRHLV